MAFVYIHVALFDDGAILFERMAGDVKAEQLAFPCELVVRCGGWSSSELECRQGRCVRHPAEKGILIGRFLFILFVVREQVVDICKEDAAVMTESSPGRRI